MEYLREKIERELKEGDELTIHTNSFIYTGSSGWVEDHTVYLEPSRSPSSPARARPTVGWSPSPRSSATA